ncbi:TRAP transporter small permease [Pseudorhodobacter turbinis]|uniref:TRAP transporter small permease protein n=1 Tax=Pseudorhodobacter turbinis TaxID=2500533 RepID=A0A4P8EHN2_9RHOB|nr:TRAP transporter small permease [Pseudorhodobacter turbinis]QCO56427.1 TRAP transporter small permease [Pseudorhodobacter turbinis]
MRRLDYFVAMALRVIPIACLVALFLLIFVNVIARTFQLAGFAWFDEVITGLFAWMVFVGSAALWRENDHFQVHWLQTVLPVRSSHLLRLLIVALGLCFLFAMTWFGASLTLKAKAMTPILSMPTSLFYAAIPISGAVMFIYSLVDLFRLFTQKETKL